MSSTGVAIDRRWPRVPLRSVATIDRSSLQADAIPAGTIYVGLEHISSDGTFIAPAPVSAGQLASSKFRFTNRHILYGKLRPYLGKIAAPVFSGVCSTDIVPVLPGPKVDRRFLLHYLRQPSMIEYASSRAVGISLPRLSPAMLEEFAVPLPPLAEQQRIAAMLDKAEAIRAKRRGAIGQFEELAQSIFVDMFGDPTTNSNGLRTELLGDHLSFVTSGGRGWAKYYVETGCRFIRSFDVQANHIADDDPAFVKVPDNAEARRTRVSEGDVLITITGSRIGRVAPVLSRLHGGYVSQHVALLRLRREHLDPIYLSFFLNLPAGGQHLIARAQYGQTKPGLNFEQIRQFRIPMPSMELQRQFVSRIILVEKAKVSQVDGLKMLASLFASIRHHFLHRPHVCIE